MVRYRYRGKWYCIKTRRLVFSSLFVAFLIVGVVSVVNIAAGQIEYWQSRQEYDLLRQYAPVVAFSSAPIPNVSSTDPASMPYANPSLQEPSVASQPIESVEAMEALKPTPKQLSEINPDYIGWMCIEGTSIDYPIVQGTDNQKYLAISFSGDTNDSGAIFMDNRCTDQFGSPMAVIYGHNMNDGSMFSDLSRYLDSGYFAEHPKLLVTTPDGVIRAYQIIAVRITDIHDAAYTLIYEDQKLVSEYLTSLGEADASKQILALSTCTNSGDDNERLLVFAAAE